MEFCRDCQNSFEGNFGTELHGTKFQQVLRNCDGFSGKNSDGIPFP